MRECTENLELVRPEVVRTRALTLVRLREFSGPCPCATGQRSAVEVRRRVRHLPGRIFELDLLLYDRVRAPDHPGSKYSESGEVKI